VKGVVEETADTKSFVLDVPEDLQDIFGYRPGQFCTFRVRLGEDELLRCYSMSSAPETDPDLTVTVKRVPGGAVSNWLLDNVAEGDQLELTKPAGVFCPKEGGRPIIGFAGGSGVTPVMSIAKSVLASAERPMRMLYANRDRGSVIFDEQLRRMEATHEGRLTVRQHLDADGGYLSPEDITGFVGDQTDADFYICGPGPFMDLVEHALLGLGVDPDRISIERFLNAGQPVPGSGDAADAAAADAEAASDVPESITVILKRKKHTIAYQPGDTVLEAARRGGLSAPFSCEAGNCATCMALLKSGAATMRANHALTPEEVEEGWILTCQALPEGDAVVVEYESF
jgi:ferredoxin-NADP reductase